MEIEKEKIKREIEYQISIIPFLKTDNGRNYVNKKIEHLKSLL